MKGPTLPQRLPLEWLRDAACRRSDFSIWDTPSQRSGISETHPALGLCATCPVRIDCALDALECGDVGVIRAGVPIPETGRIGLESARKALGLVVAGGSTSDALAVARPDLGLDL